MGFKIGISVFIGELSPEAPDPFDQITEIASNTGGSIIAVSEPANNQIRFIIFYEDFNRALNALTVFNKVRVIEDISDIKESKGELITRPLRLETMTISEGFADSRFTPEEIIDLEKLKRQRTIENFQSPRGI